MTELTAPLDSHVLHDLGSLELAYVGDGVFELLVRTALIRHGGGRVGDLHRAAVAYVAAPAQAAALERLTPKLTEEEEKIVHRGRNAHVHGCPAGCTPAQYHAATALEALFGWLWLAGRRDRVRELFAEIWEEDHAS